MNIENKSFILFVGGARYVGGPLGDERFEKETLRYLIERYTGINDHVILYAEGNVKVDKILTIQEAKRILKIEQL